MKRTITLKEARERALSARLRKEERRQELLKEEARHSVDWEKQTNVRYR